jgi:hypothetical protein
MNRASMSCRKTRNTSNWRIGACSWRSLGPTFSASIKLSCCTFGNTCIICSRRKLLPLLLYPWDRSAVALEAGCCWLGDLKNWLVGLRMAPALVEGHIPLHIRLPVRHWVLGPCCLSLCLRFGEREIKQILDQDNDKECDNRAVLEMES